MTDMLLCMYIYILKQAHFYCHCHFCSKQRLNLYQYPIITFCLVVFYNVVITLGSSNRINATHRQWNNINSWYCHITTILYFMLQMKSQNFIGSLRFIINTFQYSWMYLFHNLSFSCSVSVVENNYRWKNILHGIYFYRKFYFCFA